MALATVAPSPTAHADDTVDDYDKYEQEFYGSKAPTPNMIRGKIRKFLTATGMKVSEATLASSLHDECTSGDVVVCGRVSKALWATHWRPPRDSSSLHSSAGVRIARAYHATCRWVQGCATNS
jgi:hypothetical protein